jgi:ADP-ribose pyrophosphatase YjhB (NUDIX family)
LKREVFEETKLNLTKEPRLVCAQDILRPDKHVVRLTYIGQIEGEPVLDEDHVSYKWLTVDEIKNQEGIDQYFKEVFTKFLL